MERLNRISARGFRSIQDAKDLELGNLNVLVGPNGAGKSNLLLWLRMAAAMMGGDFQRFVARNGGMSGLLTGGLKETKEMRGRLVFQDGEFRFVLGAAGDDLVFQDEQLLLRGQWYVEETRRVLLEYLENLVDWAGGSGTTAVVREADLPTIAHDAGYDVESLPSGDGVRFRFSEIHRESEAIGVMDEVLEPISSWRRYHFADTGSTSGLRREQRVRDNLRLQEDGGNLASVLRDLHASNPRRYREIVETVRLAAPSFGNFVTRPDPGERAALEWVRAGYPDHVLGSGELSDGVLRFICLTTLLLLERPQGPDLVMIDEPELGLHPFALELLAEMLRAASEERQIVVSTQSADLVSHFTPEEVIVVEADDGISTFRRLDSGSLKDWLEDYSLGALWQMGVVGGGPAP